MKRERGMGGWVAEKKTWIKACTMLGFKEPVGRVEIEERRKICDLSYVT